MKAYWTADTNVYPTNAVDIFTQDVDRNARAFCTVVTSAKRLVLNSANRVLENAKIDAFIQAVNVDALTRANRA